MSLSKSSPAYARHMDEVMREERDNDAQLYAEWCYHRDRERIEQMWHDKALNEQTNKPKTEDNVDQRSK